MLVFDDAISTNENNFENVNSYSNLDNLKGSVNEIGSHNMNLNIFNMDKTETNQLNLENFADTSKTRNLNASGDIDNMNAPNNVGNMYTENLVNVGNSLNNVGNVNNPGNVRL